MEINQIMQVREKKNKERATNKAYIGVELSNKAGEVVVLEIFWKQILCKIHMLPHHKSVPTFNMGALDTSPSRHKVHKYVEIDFTNKSNLFL